jgi:glycosyltransferase involved in cell wall biosynthesis
LDEVYASIIIPCKRIDDYVEECVRYCLGLSYAHFEVLVLPDNEQSLSFDDPRVKVIPTGVVKPSVKRNVGIKCASSLICALIDADAYPCKDWLTNAARHFQDPDVAAVGGPGVTPKSDSLPQRAGGLILSSKLGGGGLAYRYTLGKRRNDEDLPTCNLVLRKSVLDKLGGFNTNHWPGEDTWLSLQITKHLKMKMVYEPAAVVYHHRRPLFKQHLKQIWSYGLHRGFFVKKFPETSRRPIYFAPSLFVIGLIVGLALSFWNPALMMLYISVLGIYLTACLIEGLKTKNLRITLLVFPGMFLTHITYGIAFLKGLATKNLKE